MKPITTFSILALLLITAGLLATSQQDFANVEIKAHQVADGVYMLEGRGGNIGVSVGDDGILMIDDQFAPLADKIRAALKQLHSGDLRYVLNTHFHGDHTGGNAEFSKQATIVAHNNVRTRLSSETVGARGTNPPQPQEAWPVITFDSEITFHFNGDDIRAMHYPKSHTDGDAIIYFSKANVVHMGDTFFVGRFPYVDLRNGGTVQGLIRTIESVYAELPENVKIIPGHGPLSGRADLKGYLDMLQETTELVQGKIAAGKNLEGIKAEGLPEKFAPWGTGWITTDRWIETVHASLTAEEQGQ